MFHGDNPILESKEDSLDRESFSNHLGDAICNWKDNGSLVIALNGEWGVGKSSIINMAVNHINYEVSTEKPTIVFFNPWIYSDLKNLTSEFFMELSKELEIQNQTTRDKKIAEKLKLYSDLLNVLPEKSIVKATYEKFLIGIGIAGISLSSITDWLGIPIKILKLILLIGGVGLIFITLAKGSLKNLSSYFETRSTIKAKTAFDLKQEITNELLERNKKLVIIIDDIDRLTKEEILEIFRLIKINADFPNTIYLLSFDKAVVEKSLDVSLGISGARYLEKIIQVTFDVPDAKINKIYKYFFDELTNILSKLPNSVRNFFSSDSSYWGNIFNAGIKCFFKNLRHVKRFTNSLEFNISQMYKGDVLEVNPVDFIAIEAIRVFVPKFYNFMRQNKELFTSTLNSRYSQNNRQNQLKEAISNYTGDYEKTIIELLKLLFPQLEGILERGYSTYGPEHIPVWTRALRVCSPTHFDSYFVYLPKGGTEEISQYELENFIKKANSRDEFNQGLFDYIQNGKIKSLLDLFEIYVGDENKIPITYIENMITSLLNIIDFAPKAERSLERSFEWGVIVLIYQLLSRHSDKDINYRLLQDAIRQSTSLHGIVLLVTALTQRNESNTIIKHEHLLYLQQMCITCIKDSVQNNTLIENEHLLEILFEWKAWEQQDSYKLFINNITSTDNTLLKFLNAFKRISFRTSIGGDYVSVQTVFYDFKDLKEFVNDIEDIKEKVAKIKITHNQLYEEYKEVVDSFLRDYGNTPQIN